MADSREPVALGKVIEAALGPARCAQLRQQLALRNGWAEIAGPVLAGRVRPVALSGGVLWLEADSPPFAQEAQLRSTELLEAANRLLGPDVVREVRIGKSRPTASRSPRRPPGKS
jgi:predicted nucleic acid-binding Zn ribbon protein